ncbi:polyketide cyclase/dehydrase/lipid transport protein [Kribbella steppae]|uniref:Polyketide cyclase/dehydrase/lipid transport protein n=1 Tax=Kribbella steppae TaxID=2512223 RepID=A0A4R2HCW8_9ACTN|nr:SRPBCC family protein [Kribbella steppae]TCO26150.1 polyketide cyclase/dehydrase/lipid transport protein [Kribbella steppae]
MSTSRHLSTHIDRPTQDVYTYASNPANVPEWAAGLGGSIEQVDGDWVADSPMGRVVVKFAESNEYGVVDHEVALPSGETVYNPMRVIPDGDGCEVVFTIRQRPDMTDDDFARDANAVQADLQTLKKLLEGN